MKITNNYFLISADFRQMPTGSTQNLSSLEKEEWQPLRLTGWFVLVRTTCAYVVTERGHSVTLLAGVAQAPPLKGRISIAEKRVSSPRLSKGADLSMQRECGNANGSERVLSAQRECGCFSVDYPMVHLSPLTSSVFASPR
jgi:hypothetical protein